MNQDVPQVVRGMVCLFKPAVKERVVVMFYDPLIKDGG
jgi:hypothetical protein